MNKVVNIIKETLDFLSIIPVTIVAMAVALVAMIVAKIFALLMLIIMPINLLLHKCFRVPVLFDDPPSVKPEQYGPRRWEVRIAKHLAKPRAKRTTSAGRR
jgi:hypothetical protein